MPTAVGIPRPETSDLEADGWRGMVIATRGIRLTLNCFIFVFRKILLFHFLSFYFPVLFSVIFGFVSM
jgi:hypothetical protein